MTKVTDPAPGLILIGAACFAICILLTSDWKSLGFLAILGVFTLVLLRVRPFSLARRLLSSWPIALITCLAHWLITSYISASSGGYLKHLLNFEELPTALLFTVRLVIFIFLLLTLELLHDPLRYGKAIGNSLARLPFGRQTFAQLEIMSTIALRMLPGIRRHYRQLELALQARGESQSRSILKRLHRMRRLSYPLIAHSLQNAEYTAIALQARGFDPTIRRTQWQARPLTVKEILLTLIFCSLSILIVASKWI